jgi:Na+-translocating ferredoxin:NAD+ oxidoreductase RnfG subunit
MRLWMVVIAACAALEGCTADQVYASVRNAQRLQCHRMADDTLRQRCLLDANVSHQTYREQADKRQPPPPRAGQEPACEGGAGTPSTGVTGDC